MKLIKSLQENQSMSTPAPTQKFLQPRKTNELQNFTQNEDGYTRHQVDETDKNVEQMSTGNCRPAESFKDLSEKPALSNRPEPPPRPPLPTFLDSREENEIRLVVVGRTGSGKSATGNTIMGKSDHFEAKLTAGSVTRECKRGECKNGGRKIVVIDTPGLFDTRLPYEQISQEIIRCVNMSTPGPHAFLLVIQLSRFTEEEIATFNRLFDLFGDGMGRFAIVTFTYLDGLEREKTTLEQFLEKAPDELNCFLKRCSYRSIAFDNNASDRKKSAKVKHLIKLVDSLANHNGEKYYTNAMYKEAEEALQRKLQDVVEKRELQKKKEIDKIKSGFIDQIESVTKKNKKLEKDRTSQEVLQRQAKRDKDEAKRTFKILKEDMKKLDKKHDNELYRMKKQEKIEKENQAKALQEKETQHFQLLHSMQQDKEDMDRRFKDIERQKDLQLLKATENYDKKMREDIQMIISSTDKKHDEMMKALEAKERVNEKLQEQVKQQTASVKKLIREKDIELNKQRDEQKKLKDEELNMEREKQFELTKVTEIQNKRMEAEIQRMANENSQKHIEIKEALEAKEKLQEKLFHETTSMQSLINKRDRELLKKQEEHTERLQMENKKAQDTLKEKLAEQTKSLEDAKELILKEQKELNMAKTKEVQDLKRKTELLQEQMKKNRCLQS